MRARAAKRLMAETVNELPLRDIHLPDVSLWWPPAPGWWILVILVVVAIFYSKRLIRWWRFKPVKRLSLSELNRIRDDLNTTGNEQQAQQEISVLLRRTVMSYYGRNLNASLSGDKWVRKLEQLVPVVCFSAQQSDWLSNGRYQRESYCDIQSMIDSCERWIRALPRRNINVSN